METNILETMAQEASRNSHYEEGDYLNEDGLLTCGKCHTPKQCRFIATWDGKEKEPYTPCACARERQNAEEQARQAQTSTMFQFFYAGNIKYKINIRISWIAY